MLTTLTALTTLTVTAPFGLIYTLVLIFFILSVVAYLRVIQTSNRVKNLGNYAKANNTMYEAETQRELKILFHRQVLWARLGLIGCIPTLTLVLFWLAVMAAKV